MAPKTKNLRFKRKLLNALKSDPKKTAVLTVLVVMLGMMWARMVMKKSDTPASASARDAFAVTDNHTLAAADDAAPGADRWRRNEIPPLTRNLFTVKLDNFPLDGAAPQAATVQASDGFWDQLAKSMATRADQKKERAALLENLAHQAGQLRLQSIMMGAKPRAVINDELVGEGSEVKSVVASGTDQAQITFRVLKIEPRRIIIEREGVKLEIQMN
jgi:hypothetical protein